MVYKIWKNDQNGLQGKKSGSGVTQNILFQNSRIYFNCLDMVLRDGHSITYKF